MSESLMNRPAHATKQSRSKGIPSSPLRHKNMLAREMWSTRTLQRNVSSQYYHRLLQSQDKALVHDEMKEQTKPLQDKLE